VQDGVDGSMLELYRMALAMRRATPALGEGDMAWLDAPDGALCFTREPGFGCIVNVSADPVEVPAGWQLALSSAPLVDGRVAPDTTAWFTR
jgi:alpha-glucosidase